MTGPNKMKIGEHKGGYFSENDEFKTELSTEALKELIAEYKLCCRQVAVKNSIAASQLCAHELAEAKQWQIRKKHLELFLRCLSCPEDNFAVENLVEHFSAEPEDWSLILKEKINNDY